MRRTAIILLVIGLVAAACGGTSAVDDSPVVTVEESHSDEVPHSEEGVHSDEGMADDGRAVREIAVVASEFAFSPTSFTVTEGETVRFVVHNEGAAPHEFRLTTLAAAQDHIAAGHAVHGESGDHAEAVVLVDPGATGVLEVMFHDDAEYTMAACLLPGHFEAGMKAELEIQ